ncbi:hypothetical protein BH23VER1_BH23VER1_08970 [soil metagenome]
MPDFTDPENFQLTFLAAAGVVVLFFALRGFFRGIVRLVFGMVSLAVGAMSGYQVYVHGRDWFAPVLANSGSETLLWVAGGVAVLTYLILSLIGRSIADSFAGDGKVAGPARLGGALLSLVPSLFFIWVIAMVLRLTGTVTGLETLDRWVQAEDGTAKGEAGFWRRALTAFEEGWLGHLFAETDPVTSEETGKLAKLLFLMKDADAWERVKADPQVAAVLNDPRVQKLMANEDVLYDVAHSGYAQVLRQPEVGAAASSPELAPKLRALPIEEVADEALFAPRAMPYRDADGTEVRRAIPVRQRNSPGGSGT